MKQGLGRKDQQETNENKDPCLFVNYLRTNSVVVEDILRRLKRIGFNVWWDRDIPSGADWEASIMGSLDRSEAFLGFISSGIRESGWGIKEIKLAIERKEARMKKGLPYTIVFIFLDKVSQSAFPDEIRAEMKKFQYIPFWERGGITEVFIRSLMSADWPDSIIAPNSRQKVREMAGSRKAGNLGDFFKGDDIPFRSYHRLGKHTDKVERDGDTPGYYRLSPSQMESDTAYPIIMDNQWVPPEFYDEKFHLHNEFLEKGFTSSVVREEIVSRQRKEILRSLLHNWQIVVNRASIINSPVFRVWYSKDHPEYMAFRNLLGDDSIVVYLFGENNPAPKQLNFDHQDLSPWETLCLDCPMGKEVACLRFDWSSKENEENSDHQEDANDHQRNLMANRFQYFCVTTAQNPTRLNSLATAFSIAPDRQSAFAECWWAIHSDASAWNQVNGTPYTRERFYESFLVNAKKTKVNDCILDMKNKKYREFIPVLKQIIDYLYATNLPETLQIQPYLPPDSGLNPFLLAEDSTGQRQRELTTDQLLYAVREFEHVCEESCDDSSKDFLTDPMPYPLKIEELSLEMVWELRKTEQWQHYLRALTDGKTRARLNEVDFYNIPKIWNRHHALLKKAKEDFPGLEWEDRSGALSVIYRFEGLTLITVYGNGRKKMRLPSDDDVKRSGVRKRKTRLHIDYVCTDVLEDGWATPLQTEVRLFEGLTCGEERTSDRTNERDEKGRTVYQEGKMNLYDELVKELKALNFEKV